MVSVLDLDLQVNKYTHTETNQPMQKKPTLFRTITHIMSILIAVRAFALALINYYVERLFGRLRNEREKKPIIPCLLITHTICNLYK